MSDIRDLSSHEREVLEFLLQGEWDGASALREQLASAKHAGTWSASTASFTVLVDENAPRAAVDMAKAPKLDDLYLKVEDGVLVGLECNRSTLPKVDELAA
jgi:hypothetical protein